MHANRGRIGMRFACKITCKYELYPGKFNYDCRQFACILREMLAA